MKKTVFFVAILSLFITAVAVSAQTRSAADFSGKWNLDLAKSKLSDSDKKYIEAQTLTITQTGTDMKVGPSTKRPGGNVGGDIPITYTLGRETTVNLPGGPAGTSTPVTSNSKWNGAKLVVSIVRTMSPPFEGQSSVKETYELGADGKSLTVIRESSSSVTAGTSTSTRVYTKGS